MTPRIERYGITLLPLTEADLELVRGWRNRPEIRSKMLYTGYIDADAHVAWFSALDRQRNFYFIIEACGVRLGVTHLKDLRDAPRYAEWGIYVIPRERGALVPVKAAAALLQFGFDSCRLECITATVRPENLQARRLNEALGFTLTSSQPSTVALHYNLEEVAFRAALRRFSRILR